MISIEHGNQSEKWTAVIRAHAATGNVVISLPRIVLILVLLFTLSTVLVIAEPSTANATTTSAYTANSELDSALVPNDRIITKADGTIIIELPYIAGEPVPVAEAKLMFEGKEYQLAFVEEGLVDNSYVAASRSFSQQITKDVPLEGIDKLNSYFPLQVSIAEGEFRGSIGLDAVTPFQTQTVYEKWSGQVDRVHIIDNLPNNDVINIPKTMDFLVRDDATSDATITKTLSLTDCVFNITSFHELGYPNKYSAQCTYRGEEHWLEPHHYSVSANYSGTIISSNRGLVVNASYKLPVPLASKPAAELKTVSEIVAEPTPATNQVDILPAAIAATTAVISAVGVLLLLLFLFRGNARLVATKRPAVFGEGKSYRTLCRQRLKVRDGAAEFVVPDSIALYDDEFNFSIVMKSSVARNADSLVLIWRDRVIQKSKPATVVHLSFSELLSDSIETPEFKDAIVALSGC